MDPEAVSLLQLVKEPIGVVSVCGRARQGKSYILNQVLFDLFQGETLGFGFCRNTSCLIPFFMVVILKLGF